MKEYREYRPTGFDPKGLALDDQQDWLVVPVGRNRDSGPLDESNFECALKALGGESDDVQVHRFGHWACGWFEIIIVRPESKAAKEARDIEAALSNYPVLDDMDYSDRMNEAANEIWRGCYSEKERVDYIRRKRGDFYFHDFKDLMSCVRGKHFAGDCNSLVGG